MNVVFINNKPLNSTGYGAGDFPSGAGDRVVTDIVDGGTIIRSGESATVRVWIWNDGTNGYSSLSSGTSVNVRLRSAGGMDN